MKAVIIMAPEQTIMTNVVILVWAQVEAPDVFCRPAPPKPGFGQRKNDPWNKQRC